MRLFKWQQGRQQGCEYFKFPMWYFKIWKFGFDGYILRYNGDSILGKHTDKIEGAKHYRLNIGWGIANFCCNNIILKFRIGKLTFYLFRPDLYEHSLYIFEKTYKLSLGFVKFT